YASEHGLRLRPHTKTHKTPILAHKQIEAGAQGVTCAKLGEAEVMAAAGIRDILVANQVVGRIKINRLVALSRHTDIIVAADDPNNVREISDAAQTAGTK
ncbi:MAG TPA: alanine racemase, partial [Candidatus Latescibacteria bacterium]|nr:alanine racemase [Candidatus Latescibacterota bacterium]